MANTISKFSDTYIDKLTPKKNRYEVKEKSGLRLEVMPSGTKVWRKRERVNGKPKTITLGKYPQIVTQKARDLYFDVTQDVTQGQETVEYLATEFYHRYILKNRKTPDRNKQVIFTDIIPSIGSLKSHLITTRQIVLALNEIVDRGAPVQAKSALSLTKQMFNWGVSQGLVTSNPAAPIRAKDVGGADKPVDRYLELGQLLILWEYLQSGKHKIMAQNTLALKIIILTGVRTQEIREAEWSELDYDECLWTIPKNKYKTGIDHKIPLNAKLLCLFDSLRVLSRGSKWCIPSATDITLPLTERALARIAARLQGRIEGVHKWTPHDLRRTFRTLISQEGIADPIVGEKLLGHKMPKIMATYDRDEMLPQRREALEKWSNLFPEV